MQGLANKALRLRLCRFRACLEAALGDKKGRILAQRAASIQALIYLAKEMIILLPAKLITEIQSGNLFF